MGPQAGVSLPAEGMLAGVGEAHVGAEQIILF